MNLRNKISLKLWGSCRILLNAIKDKLKDIHMFVGLAMLAVGLWGLSENFYLPLAIIGCEFMVLGAGYEKGGEQKER